MLPSGNSCSVVMSCVSATLRRMRVLFLRPRLWPSWWPRPLRQPPYHPKGGRRTFSPPPRTVRLFSNSRRVWSTARCRSKSVQLWWIQGRHRLKSAPTSGQLRPKSEQSSRKTSPKLGVDSTNWVPFRSHLAAMVGLPVQSGIEDASRLSPRVRAPN